MGTLALLTVVSGIADAASYLGLDHVFVANMTGNVVLLGFAAAGAAQLSVSASLVALAGFLAGSAAGGALARRWSEDRSRWLRAAFAIQLGPVTAATAIAATSGHTGTERYVLIALLALAMGLQNATVRALAVPDMSTTVLTQTLSGLAADSSAAGGDNPRWVRRSGAVVLMLAGAAVGAVLVLDVGMPEALGALLAVAAAAVLVARRV